MSRPSRGPTNKKPGDLSAALRREQILDRFEADGNAGKPLSIEAALAEAAEAERPELFLELLLLEISIRRRRGERVEPHEYRTRFPGYTAQIFVAQIEDSGILRLDSLKEFLPPAREPRDARDLARDLVRGGKLTKMQAEEIHKGKGKSLILGKYTLLERIGAGGMGQVFKAEHRRMHRTVAVKMLPVEFVKDTGAIARFEREVMAAAATLTGQGDADETGLEDFPSWCDTREP